MGDKTKIDQLYSTVDKDKKKKVVILAEDNGGASPVFVNQATGWAKDNPSFDVEVIPYYNSTHVSSDKGRKISNMKDVSKKLRAIDGNFTLGLMGHSGYKMGGFSISPLVKESERRKKLKYIYNEQQQLQDEVLWDDATAEKGVLSKSGELARKATNKFRVEKIDKEIRKAEKYMLEERTITDLVQAHSNKIDNVMVGACHMGTNMGEIMQDLSTTTNKNVYCQGRGSWGTGAIKSKGEEPWENYFVSGKPVDRDIVTYYELGNTDMDVGGVVFSPDKEPAMIEKRHTTGKMKLHRTPIIGRRYEEDWWQDRPPTLENADPSGRFRDMSEEELMTTVVDFSREEVSDQSKAIKTYNDSLYSHIKYDKAYQKNKTRFGEIDEKTILNEYWEAKDKERKTEQFAREEKEKPASVTTTDRTTGGLADYFRQYD